MTPIRTYRRLWRTKDRAGPIVFGLAEHPVRRGALTLWGSSGSSHWAGRPVPRRAGGETGIKAEPCLAAAIADTSSQAACAAAMPVISGCIDSSGQGYGWCCGGRAVTRDAGSTGEVV